MSFKHLTFNKVFENFNTHCEYFGNPATHNFRVKDTFHCNHPDKIEREFNWACTIESCPHFELLN